MNKDHRLIYMESRGKHYDQVALHHSKMSLFSREYHRRLVEIFKNFIPDGQRVLELGCGFGDLLASLNPAQGVGVDISNEMIKVARLRHPHLQFEVADAHSYENEEQFDYIILSDLINDSWDLQEILNQIKKMSGPSTKIIFNFYNRVWQPLLDIGAKLNLAKPSIQQNWFSPPDVVNILNLADFVVIKSSEEILLPVPIPLINGFFNKFLVRFIPFKWFALTKFLIAAPKSHLHPVKQIPGVSIVVPARNEAGNIANILERIPQMGSFTEIIFVEGHSKDNTYLTIQEEIKKHPEKMIAVYQQTGKGKGDAVRLGFQMAKGDILMILDADLTVVPEDLPKFYEILIQNKAEFVNGVRLVYPTEEKAMRFLNMIGNKFFSLLFSWLLGQSVKDTLCGTKVLWRRDYERIQQNRFYFGNFDPFGDFDLLFGAAKLNYRIVDLPVRYRERTYGTTNIQRWSHGWLLLKMAAYAMIKLKFV